ncbi:hypothetical protein ACFV4F_40935, partial [Kitasatospora sp. NPDC059722]
FPLPLAQHRPGGGPGRGGRGSSRGGEPKRAGSPPPPRHPPRQLRLCRGRDTDPGALSRWIVVHTTNGNVGVLYLAPPRSAVALREDFEAMLADERSRGVEPEFDAMALIATPEEAAALAGPQVDYLQPVLRRYAEHHRATAAGRLRR